MTSPITLVSCYYQISGNTKRSPEQYKQWIFSFLKHCKTPIVFFSDGPIADELDAFRKGQSPEHAAHWLLIKRPIHSLSYTSPQDYEYWSWCMTQDSFANLHTPEMFIFWANKTQLVKEVAQTNPFQSSHFFWCDAGCWRNELFAEIIAPSWPSIQKLPDRLLLTWVDHLESSREATRQCETLQDFVLCDALRNTCTVAGAIFGGPATLMVVFADLYTRALRLSQIHAKFAGDDQSILAALGLFLERKGLVQNVLCKESPPFQGADNWFALQYLLA